MIIRNVTMKLKDKSAEEFSRRVKDEVLPLLRKQAGFTDLVTFVAPERSEAVAISFWKTREDAEAYDRAQYQGVLKSLSNILNGTPKVETFELSISTLHKLAASGA